MVAAPVLALRPGPSGPRISAVGVFRAPALPQIEAPEGLPRGRLIELAGGPAAARTSVAVQILLASQREGDPVAWVQARGGGLYPPDLAACGLDLDALLVVQVPASAGPAGMPKAAELVLRTGAFGAVVIDVDGAALPRGEAWLGRLGSLTRENDCRSVLLTAPSDRSLGPLIALRLLAERRRSRPGRYALATEVLKDKSGSFGLGSGGRATLPGPRAWVGPEGMP